ncbi:MAG: hypothetical protein Q8L48_28575 [Archangium sp.]|nr:hypothetical protein [Archangium sp.]
MDLLLLALVVALLVWGFRQVRDRVKTAVTRRERASRPGYSPDNPLVLASPRVLEEAQAAARCGCGGRVLSLGETSRLGLRVAKGRCLECDTDVDLYFVLPHLLN